MALTLSGIELQNFKSYVEKQEIKFSDLSILLGANSSGKSTAMQAILVIKQTMECNSPDEQLLLSGKYVTLGDFDDVVYDHDKSSFSYKIILNETSRSEDELEDDTYSVRWSFEKGNDGISTKLSLVKICFQDICLDLKTCEDNLYHIYMNDKRIPYSVKISNLLFDQFTFHYDEELNNKTIEFINKISCVLNGPKTATIATENVFFTEILDDFYFKILDRTNENGSVNVSDNTKYLSEEINRLLDHARELQFPQYEIAYHSLPNDIRKTILSRSIANLNSCEEIISVVESFGKYLKEYQGSKKCIEEYTGEKSLGKHPFVLMNRTRRKEDDLSRLKYALDFYNDLNKKIISQIFFVGPIRETPKGLYNVGFEAIPKYVGPTGAYFASVLLHESKRTKKYILPHSIEECSLSDALSEWLVHLNIANNVSVNKKTSFGFSVTVENMQYALSDIMNVGIGTSQILPVLISVLLSEPGEILMFEQPELHLHPYSQSRLADLFIAYCKEGRKIILETHSEYLLLRLRYNIVKGLYSNKASAVNLFQNNEGTKVKHANISGYGDIEYPSDFRDETQQLLDDLLDAMIERKGL